MRTDLLSSAPPVFPIYVNHMGGDLARFYHSCPNFVAMTQEEREKTCLAAKVCLSCLSPALTFSPSHLTDCNKRKEIKVEVRTKYFCQVNRCIWTCVRHRSAPTNTGNIPKRKDQMAQRGWTMGMIRMGPG